MLGGEFRGFAHHARAALGRGREDHLGAECAHDLAALHGEGLDHDGDERVALGGADHRERDAGVARSGLDDRLAGSQRAAALGILDDRDRQPVLHRVKRVERLALHEHRGVRGGEPVDANDGRVADR